MKKNFGVKNWMFPMPVLMIGTYNEDGTPNMMNAAWGGITLEDQITICIDTSHRTWANITARKAFTVAFGTADTVASCDYLGLVSGKEAADKVAKSGLTAVKSGFVDAPVGGASAGPGVRTGLDERGELQRGGAHPQLRGGGIRPDGRQA